MSSKQRGKEYKWKFKKANEFKADKKKNKNMKNKECGNI